MSHDNHNEEEDYNFFETMTYSGGTGVFAVFWVIISIAFIILILTMG